MTGTAHVLRRRLGLPPDPGAAGWAARLVLASLALLGRLDPDVVPVRIRHAPRVLDPAPRPGRECRP